MTSRDLKDALHAEPFVPFRIHMPSGKHLDVLNPDLVAVSSNGRTAFVFRGGKDGGFDFVDILLIERREALSGSIGRRRRSA
jgi:hypothetical protein